MDAVGPTKPVTCAGLAPSSTPLCRRRYCSTMLSDSFRKFGSSTILLVSGRLGDADLGAVTDGSDIWTASFDCGAGCGFNGGAGVATKPVPATIAVADVAPAVGSVSGVGITEGRATASALLAVRLVTTPRLAGFSVQR